MSDEQQQRDPARSIIILSQDRELRYWTQELGVSEVDLRRAVLTVGNTPDAVRKFLGRD